MGSAKKEKISKSKKAPKVKINFSPIKRNKWANHVDVYQTLCTHVLIVIATRFDRPEGSFLHYMKMKFLDDAETLAPLWKIIGFFFRRDNQVGAAENTPMLKCENSTFYWDSMVALKEGEDTPASIGRHIAKQFTTFTETCNLFQRKATSGVV